MWSRVSSGRLKRNSYFNECFGLDSTMCRSQLSSHGKFPKALINATKHCQASPSTKQVPRPTPPSVWCHYHRSTTHSSEECRTLVRKKASAFKPREGKEEKSTGKTVQPSGEDKRWKSKQTK